MYIDTHIPSLNIRTVMYLVSYLFYRENCTWIPRYKLLKKLSGKILKSTYRSLLPRCMTVII